MIEGGVGRFRLDSVQSFKDGEEVCVLFNNSKIWQGTPPADGLNITRGFNITGTIELKKSGSGQCIDRCPCSGESIGKVEVSEGPTRTVQWLLPSLNDPNYSVSGTVFG